MRGFVQRCWPWAVLAGSAYLFAALRPWLEPDEGRYAEIPREMLVTGDWITPHLNGMVYLEKPPLQYWATAIAYSIFGVNEFSSRIYSITLALLAIPLAYLAARRISGDDATGRAAAVALAVSPYFLLIGHLNLLDGAFATLLAAALTSFIYAQLADEPRRTRGFMLACWAALAAALLQKGIVVFVLCGGTLVAYTVVARDVSVWRRLYLLPGLAILLAMTAGWFVLVAQRNPGFLRFFFIHEHFERFLTTVHKHSEPWWYFVPFGLLAVIPFLGHVIPAVRQAWSQGARSAGFRPALFMLLWCAVVFAFFSASGSKLATYIMPCVPFLAVLLAPRIAANHVAIPRATLVTAALLLLGAIAIVVIAHRRSSDHVVPATVAFWAAVVVIGAVAAIVAMLVMRGREERTLLWQPLVACAAVGWLGLMMAYASAPPIRTASLLVQQVRDRIGPDTVVYSVAQYRQTLPPYLQRTVHVAAYEGEFEAGMDRGTSSRLLTLEMFERAWDRETDAVAFVSPKTYATFASKGIPGRVIATDDRSVVIERK